MSDSVQPHRRQPTRLLRPWNFQTRTLEWEWQPCHFLLQCMKVKSETEVTQSCLTLCDPKDCSLPGSSVHGIFQARVLEWGAIAFSMRFMSPSCISSLSSWFCKETVKWKSTSRLEDNWSIPEKSLVKSNLLSILRWNWKEWLLPKYRPCANTYAMILF